MKKEIIFGFGVTDDDEDLVYSSEFNKKWSQKGDHSLDQDYLDQEMSVGEGYYGICSIKTRYVALSACEPYGLEYMSIESLTRDILQDFSVLSSVTQKVGNGSCECYMAPYRDIIVVDTETFDIVWFADMGEDIDDSIDTKTILGKYHWKAVHHFQKNERF
jgi:hypothetical protein